MNPNPESQPFRWKQHILFMVAGAVCLVGGTWGIVTQNMNVSRFFHPPLYLHDWDAILAGVCLVGIGGLLISLVFIGNPSGDQRTDFALSTLIIKASLFIVIPLIFLMMSAFAIKFVLLGGPTFHDTPRSERIAND